MTPVYEIEILNNSDPRGPTQNVSAPISSLTQLLLQDYALCIHWSNRQAFFVDEYSDVFFETIEAETTWMGDTVPKSRGSGRLIDLRRGHLKASGS